MFLHHIQQEHCYYHNILAQFFLAHLSTMDWPTSCSLKQLSQMLDFRKAGWGHWKISLLFGCFIFEEMSIVMKIFIKCLLFS